MPFALGGIVKTSELVAWIKSLIEEGKLWKFYKWKEWLKLKNQILEEAHYECEWCKKRGKISKAEEVHHIQFVKKYPHLAMSRYYTHKGKQHKNLVALCHDCHDKAHERMKYKKQKQFNEERW